jgi:hypothetical protein
MFPLVALTLVALLSTSCNDGENCDSDCVDPYECLTDITREANGAKSDTYGETACYQTCLHDSDCPAGETCSGAGREPNCPECLGWTVTCHSPATSDAGM